MPFFFCKNVTIPLDPKLAWVTAWAISVALAPALGRARERFTKYSGFFGNFESSWLIYISLFLMNPIKDSLYFSLTEIR